jgi:hypothetical protein
VGHGKTFNRHARKDKYIHLIENPEVKRSLGRPRCRRANIIKMDLKETALSMGTSGGMVHSNYISPARD